jgi:hypothetical protein
MPSSAAVVVVVAVVVAAAAVEAEIAATAAAEVVTAAGANECNTLLSSNPAETADTTEALEVPVAAGAAQQS